MPRLIISETVSAYKDFGKCITESHWSLSNDFEISSEKSDFLVKQAESIDGVYGSKMISCSPLRSTFNIVEKTKSDSFISAIKTQYYNKFNEELTTYKFSITQGIKEFSAKKINLVEN